MTIHLISFDIILPANYGGAIDVFYKVKSLKEEGVSVILHCFYKGKLRNFEELKEYCQEVYYYKRRSLTGTFSTLPYIIASRSSKSLLNNLCKDSYPIIFEGLHTTYYLKHKLLSDRVKIVRLHNIEHEYYENLFLTERSFFKKVYFKIEALKLRKAQKRLRKANLLLAISPSEEAYFKNEFPDLPVSLVYPFTAYNNVTAKTGLGDFILYHGNLSVSENIDTAIMLINEVAHKTELPIVIAGKKPSLTLFAEAEKRNIKIIADPSDRELYSLIENAQANIVISSYNSGIKIKLFSCLFKGRKCLANSVTVSNTGFEELCTIVNSPDEIIQVINKIQSVPFSIQDLEKRKRELQEVYSVKKETQKLLKIIKTSSE